ncbi:MAG: hypothetical protein ACP5JS_08470 [Fervidobacterium sp.]
MKMPNFTMWFIIFVFVFGSLAIYVYEHFRYSPFALRVDFEVVKEYLFDRHVECYDTNFRNRLRSQQIDFSNRMSSYQFALRISSFLSKLNDGITRINVPVRKVDKVLPLKFKYFQNEVIVYETNCEIPEGATILSMNGEPIDGILEKYKGLFPNLNNYQAKYAFVDTLLSYYLKIIDANAIQLTYRLPNSAAQRTTYLKGVEKFQEKRNIVESYELDGVLFVKINSFKISSKQDMQIVTQTFEDLASKSTDNSTIVFDLRFAEDGDETIPTIIVSSLITEQMNLYPRLFVRYEDRLVEKSQIPIQPGDKKLRGRIYFLVDNSSFYTPIKVLITNVLENNLGTVVATQEEFIFDDYFYIDAIEKILPNTKAHLILPTAIVKFITPNKMGKIERRGDLQIAYSELVDIESYKHYALKIAKALSR